MGQRPPSVRLRQTGQNVTVRLASTMASAKALVSSSGRLSTKNASRCALLLPMPGQARELLNELFERRGKVFHGLNLSAL